MKSQSQTQEAGQDEINTSSGYDKLRLMDNRFWDEHFEGVQEKEQGEDEGCGFDQVDDYERMNDEDDN